MLILFNILLAPLLDVLMMSSSCSHMRFQIQNCSRSDMIGKM